VFENLEFSKHAILTPMAHKTIARWSFMNIHRLYCIYFLFFSEHNLLRKLDINYQFSQEISCTSGSTEGFLGTHYVKIMRCEKINYIQDALRVGRGKNCLGNSQKQIEIVGVYSFFLYFFEQITLNENILFFIK